MATYKRSKSLQMEDMKKRSGKKKMSGRSSGGSKKSGLEKFTSSGGQDMYIITRPNKKNGGMCKLATKGKGKAYGKNS